MSICKFEFNRRTPNRNIAFENKIGITIFNYSHKTFLVIDYYFFVSKCWSLRTLTLEMCLRQQNLKQQYIDKINYFRDVYKNKV